MADKYVEIQFPDPEVLVNLAKKSNVGVYADEDDTSTKLWVIDVRDGTIVVSFAWIETLDYRERGWNFPEASYQILDK